MIIILFSSEGSLAWLALASSRQGFAYPREIKSVAADLTRRIIEQFDRKTTMSLTFVGPSGAFERRWIVYAILRDNVQHHLEAGKPSDAFGAIHAMGEALGRGPEGIAVNAARLRDELFVVRERLLSLTIGQLAISVRTRAVTSMVYPLPDHRETGLVQALEWTLPLQLNDAQCLGDVFGSLVTELLHAIGEAGPDDQVQVVDV